MLSKNIQMIRKSKGLSQEELAVRLNVVRQTVSKWERGLSVPDSEMLISISDILETPVSILLGETGEDAEVPADDLKTIAEKLEIINLQLAKNQAAKRKAMHWCCIVLFALTAIIFVFLIRENSSYLNWDFSDPETAVAGTFFHAFEWLFIRLAPLVMAAAGAGIILTREKR